MSNATASTFAARSRVVASLIKIPCSAARPMPATTAVGVANPSAHGHAITKTVTEINNAFGNDGSGATTSQNRNDAKPATRTAGTNLAVTRSTNRSIGARVAWARSTWRMIWARSVRSPTVTTLALQAVAMFNVPAKTASPRFFTTGMLSPVSIDSSISAAPSITFASVGTRSPGRITTVSPTSISPMSTSRTPSARSTRAVRGCNSISNRTASPARNRVLPSNQRPNETNPMIAAGTSKYVPM